MIKVQQGVLRMIDMHNHVLIDVDDGPGTTKDAIALIRQAVDNGITDIIATPHHRNNYYNTRASVVTEKLNELQTVLKNEKLNIRVHPGQEIRIHGDLLQELQSGESLTLNDTQYVLVEFPFTEYPGYSEILLFDLLMAGYIPIIAHPERCKPFMQSSDRLFNLVEKGAFAQLTASSVTGKMGKHLKKSSLKMIENNLIHLIASDAHEVVTRPFAIKEAYDVITSELGMEYTDRLKRNAGKVLNGDDLITKPPNKIDTSRFKKKGNILKFFN